MFKNNPEEFINKVVRYINEQKASLVIDEIKYDITDEEPYTSDIFNLGGVVNFEKAVKVDKHITPYVVVDSDIEKNFAIDLDRDEDKVCVYAKLPKTFRIPTPVGNYSPDWAIAFYENSVKYIYFIAETKGSEQHRDEIEVAKNLCAKKLFAKLNGGNVHYDVVNSYQQLMDVMNK
jgi:type III restriction enzyme